MQFMKRGLVGDFMFEKVSRNVEAYHVDLTCELRTFSAYSGDLHLFYVSIVKIMKVIKK